MDMQRVEQLLAAGDVTAFTVINAHALLRLPFEEAYEELKTRQQVDSTLEIVDSTAVYYSLQPVDTWQICTARRRVNPREVRDNPAEFIACVHQAVRDYAHTIMQREATYVTTPMIEWCSRSCEYSWWLWGYASMCKRDISDTEA